MKKTSKKTHKTAVVIVPPEDVWDSIQRIREKYDRQFRRWMPHITLIYPFRPFGEFEEIYPEFENICREIKGFEVELVEFKFFQHYRENYTIWLEPKPFDGIVRLQKKLQTIVPDCDDVCRFEGGFTPHLSVGQVKGKDRLENLLIELRNSWRPVKFRINSVFFIWRDDPPNDVFKIWKEVKLGG